MIIFIHLFSSFDLKKWQKWGNNPKFLVLTLYHKYGTIEVYPNIHGGNEMPRPGYYNLAKTPERMEHIDYIAQRLGLGDSNSPNTIGKVIDFCLRTVRYLDLAKEKTEEDHNRKR